MVPYSLRWFMNENTEPIKPIQTVSLPPRTSFLIRVLDFITDIVVALRWACQMLQEYTTEEVGADE